MNKEELRGLILGAIEGEIVCMEVIMNELEKEIRLETLKEVLPEENKEYQESIEAGVCFSSRGFNKCRQEIINKAKDNWGIEL